MSFSVRHLDVMTEPPSYRSGHPSHVVKRTFPPALGKWPLFATAGSLRTGGNHAKSTTQIQDSFRSGRGTPRFIAESVAQRNMPNLLSSTDTKQVFTQQCSKALDQKMRYRRITLAYHNPSTPTFPAESHKLRKATAHIPKPLPMLR